MKSADIYSFLPPTLKEWGLQSLNIHFAKCPSLATILTKRGYEIIVGKEYWESLSDHDKMCALIHEIGHIVRGDCLTTSEDLNHYLANISQDACINIGKLKPAAERNQWVLYDHICEEIKTLPRHYIPGWRRIYDEILKNKPELNGGSGGTCGGVSRDKDMDYDSAEEVHAGTILDLRDSVDIDDLPPEIQSAIRGYSISGKGHHTTKVDPPKPLSTPLPDAILRAIRGQHGQRKRLRSYRREGTVEGIRGSLKVPRLNIGLAIDVSGSCTPYYEVLGGTAEFLRRKHHVTLASFACDCQDIKSLTDIPNWNGGTLIEPVFEWASTKKLDALVVATDGEFSTSGVKHPNIPVCWILPNSSYKTPYGDDPLIIIDQHES